MVDRLVVGEVGRRILLFTLEYLEGVSGDEVDRCGRESHLVAVEILEELPITVVQTWVRLVGDDQVEESDFEGLVDLVACAASPFGGRWPIAPRPLP